MKLPALLLALGLPTLALAQSSFSSHGYFGVGASVYNESLFRNSLYQSTTPTGVGPVLTAGYQLSPRLAVQLSPALQWGGNTNTYAGYQAIAGQPAASTVTRRFSRTRLLVPVQLRVTFTSAAARLRLDGLVGAAWLHDEVVSINTETDNSTGAVIRQNDFGGADNLALLTLGPALRCGLRPGLELVLALPMHYAQSNLHYYSGFAEHLSWQPQLSVHYTPGSR